MTCHRCHEPWLEGVGTVPQQQELARLIMVARGQATAKRGLPPHKGIMARAREVGLDCHDPQAGIADLEKAWNRFICGFHEASRH